MKAHESGNMTFVVIVSLFTMMVGISLIANSCESESRPVRGDYVVRDDRAREGYEDLARALGQEPDKNHGVYKRRVEFVGGSSQNNGMLVAGILLVVGVPLGWILWGCEEAKKELEVAYREEVKAWWSLEKEQPITFHEGTVISHLIRYPALIPVVKEKLKGYEWEKYALSDLTKEKFIEIIEGLGSDVDLAKFNTELHVLYKLRWIAPLPDCGLEDPEVTLNLSIDKLLKAQRVRNERCHDFSV